MKTYVTYCLYYDKSHLMQSTILVAIFCRRHCENTHIRLIPHKAGIGSVLKQAIFFDIINLQRLFRNNSKPYKPHKNANSGDMIIEI